VDARVVVASTWWRNALCFLVAVLLAVICLGPRNVLAAGCNPRCSPPVHPSQYSDPRCESRRIGERLERDDLRCDPRGRQRLAAPSATPPTPLSSPPMLGLVASMSATGTNDPGRQQPRGVERDVGFDDAFVRHTNESHVGGRPRRER
jgi:hypothetical protein